MLTARIEGDAITAFKQFYENKVTANAKKFQRMLLSRGSPCDCIITIGDRAIPEII